MTDFMHRHCTMIAMNKASEVETVRARMMAAVRVKTKWNHQRENRRKRRRRRWKRPEPKSSSGTTPLFPSEPFFSFVGRAGYFHLQSVFCGTFVASALRGVLYTTVCGAMQYTSAALPVCNITDCLFNEREC